MKEVNRYLSNEFHDWQRVNLPGKFVIQDVDTWPLVISDSTDNYNPICLIELKRSSYSPGTWTPFKADLPNYLAIFKLAQKAEIPLVTIYFQMGKPIDDDTEIAIFKINDVAHTGNDWMKFEKKVVKASQLKKEFPSILL